MTLTPVTVKLRHLFFNFANKYKMKAQVIMLFFVLPTLFFYLAAGVSSFQQIDDTVPAFREIVTTSKPSDEFFEPTTASSEIIESTSDEDIESEILEPRSLTLPRALRLPPLGKSAVESRFVEWTGTSEQTPYSDMMAFSRQEINKEFGLYGNVCTIYGVHIQKEQETDYAFEDDGRNNVLKFTRKKNDGYQTKVCKLSHRLECVRDRYLPETTQHPDDSIDDEIVPGTCRCIRALSDRAIFLFSTTEKNRKRKFRRGCYIPAGFAQASRCNHIVPLPYGIIESVGRNSRFPLKDISIRQWHLGNTSNLCVPHSRCRASSSYIGERCMCNKNTKWHRNNGTCEKIFTRRELEQEGEKDGTDQNSSRILTSKDITVIIMTLLTYIYNLLRHNQ